MSKNEIATKAANRYDKALLGSQRRRKLPPESAEPQPTAMWPPENIALLGRYWVWLTEENSTRNCIEQIYIPMAGHVLGLNLKPHPQLDLTADLDRVLDYVKAKQLSASWADICLRALHRFRRFLQYERGLLDVSFTDEQLSTTRYHEGLPDWFIEQMTHFQHVRQANWRPARLPDAIRRFWAVHTRLWRWLFGQAGIVEMADVQRQHIYAYIDERLADGYAAKSVNQDLRAFQATLRFLQERGFQIPLALRRLPMLKEPDALPRFLIDAEIGRLQQYFEQRLQQAEKPAQKEAALLDRAAFYLLWHGGLRLGEVEELCLADLNLPQQQVVVRQGKGMKDRTVYLTDVTVAALTAYLGVRGQSRSDHLFIYRHRPLCKGLIHNRLKTASQQTGVKVTAHRLRHTCATQLVNAGCKITTIQAMLGHRRLNATMVYSRVHDRTVAEDYFAAMAVIEKRLVPHLQQTPVTESRQDWRENSTSSRQLLALVNALEVQEIDEHQQQIIAELRQGIMTITAQLERFQSLG